MVINTRKLKGSGAGYFSMYNRNKRGCFIDIKSLKENRLAKELKFQMQTFYFETFGPAQWLTRFFLDYNTCKVLSATDLLFHAAKGPP